MGAAAAVPTSLGPEGSAPDYFPDEPVRYRTQIAGRLGWMRRAPRPSRRTWYIIGGLGLVLVLVAVLFAVLPGSDHTPASAQLRPTNPVLRVPGNFLNGTRATTPADTSPTSTTTSTGPTATAQSWSVTQEYGASALTLNAVTCPTASECYAVGETTFKTGMVLVSADGGSTWAQHNVPTGIGSLDSVACSTGTSCVAVGGTSVIITSDGGTTWSASTLGQNALTAVTCASPTECIVGGSGTPVTSGCDSGDAYTTTNGGHTWTTVATHCFVPSAVACASPSDCVLAGTHTNGSGQSGEILVSENGGSSWQSRYVLSDTNTQLNSVTCPTTRNCIAIGNSPTQSIVRSSNGGSSWTGADPGVAVAQRYFLAVACGSAQTCGAGGSAGPVTSTDGGVSWSAVPASSVTKILGISCPSATACVGVALDTNSAPATIKLA